MSAPEVNVPLLRKAVEWAEAEAAKPKGGLWLQSWWVSPPDSNDSYVRGLRERHGLTPQCGTAYCIAGYVCHVADVDAKGSYARVAADLLGIAVSNEFDANTHPLFAAGNTITDVRRIAESLAGERL